LFARLTVREASRKKLIWALLAVTVTVIALTGFGFRRLVTLGMSDVPGPEVAFASAFMLILVMFAYSFVLALSAVFMTVPTIAGELESGTALAILTRPVKRSHLLLGKWLGLAGLTAAYVTVASGAEFIVVNLVTDYTPPHPYQFIVYMVAETLVILSLAMLISTRLPPIAGGVIALGAFMIAWMGGVAISIGRTFDIDAMVTAGTVTRMLLPTDGMWKGAVWSLEPASLLAFAASEGPEGIGNFPFFSTSPPAPAYMGWTALWIVLVIWLAIGSFRRREI
jgi:ABC-type transport system involved in multi-copper enzyme maturation permease subunit